MMQSKIRFVLFLLAGLTCSKAWSAPTISTLSGTFSGNADDASANVITVSGTGYGTKSPAKPHVWASFNGSTVPTTLGTLAGGWNVESQNGETSSVSPLSGSGKLLSSSGWNTTTFNIAIKLPTSGYGAKVYARTGRQTSFITDVSNDKFLRWWSGAAGAQPDIIWSNESTARDLTVTVEQSAATFTSYPGGCTDGYADGDRSFCLNSKHYGPFPPAQDTNWHVDQWLFQINSAHNTADGKFAVWYDSTTATVTNKKTDATGASGNYSNGEFFIQQDPSNTPLPPSTGTVSMDDIYIDVSWKRVYIANSSNISTASVTEMGIPKTWGDTLIDFYFHQGRLVNGTTNWVFVCDGTTLDLTDCSSGKQFFVGEQVAAGQTNLNAKFVTQVGVSSFSITWSSVSANTYMTAFSTSSNFIPTIASGTMLTVTSSYANLAQHTTYYFKVGISTEGSYTSSITTFTVNTVIPTTVGSPTQTSLVATWGPAFTITRTWSQNVDLSSNISTGTATSPDTQGSLTCNTAYYFGVKVSSETSYGGNIYSGTTSACIAAAVLYGSPRFSGPIIFKNIKVGQ